jgi:hypothetical protein
MCQYKQDLAGKKVRGVFSEHPYTGVITESIQEPRGWNHIIRLDKPITLRYNNPTQTRANNRMVLKMVNFSTHYQETATNPNTLTIVG